MPVGADGSIDTAQAYASQVAGVIERGLIFDNLRYMCETGHRRIAELDEHGEPTGKFTIIKMTNREYLAAVKQMSTLAIAHTRIQGEMDGQPGDDAKEPNGNLDVLLNKADED